MPSEGGQTGCLFTFQEAQALWNVLGNSEGGSACLQKAERVEHLPVQILRLLARFAALVPQGSQEEGVEAAVTHENEPPVQVLPGKLVRLDPFYTVHRNRPAGHLLAVRHVIGLELGHELVQALPSGFGPLPFCCRRSPWLPKVHRTRAARAG